MFFWDYAVNGDNLKFTAKILVRNNLTKSELRDVLDHERQHWRDFDRRAADLKAAVEKATKEGRDPLLDDRLGVDVLRLLPGERCLPQKNWKAFVR